MASSIFGLLELSGSREMRYDHTMSHCVRQSAMSHFLAGSADGQRSSRGSWRV